MDLSNNLISQFAKITKDDDKTSKESTVYGTVINYADRMYVQIDGSSLLTPVETTATIQSGERVTVLIKDHSATIIGNITVPSASSSTVKKVVEDVDGISVEMSRMETATVEKVDAINKNLANNYSTTVAMNSAINQKANEINIYVSETYTSKDDAADTYATKAELKATSTELKATFEDGYEMGITIVNKDGIKITHSGYKGYTNMSAGGFYVNDGTEDVISCTENGLVVKGTVTGSVITASTFNSTNDTFQVYDDGEVSAMDISVSNTMSANTVSAEKLNVAWHDRCLTRRMKVYIKPSHTYEDVDDTNDLFYYGATFCSFADVKQIAPRNLNGYILDIHMSADVTENIVMDGFNNGRINIHMNGYTINGSIAMKGISTQYYIYGNNSGSTGGSTRGSIKPSIGYMYGDYSFCVYNSSARLNLYDVDLYKGTSASYTHNCICIIGGSSAYISAVKAVNTPNCLIRAYTSAHVYVASSSGTTSSTVFQAIQGAIIQLAATTQCGRPSSSTQTYTNNNGQIFSEGVTWDSTAATGTNSNTSTTTTTTVTKTITSDYGDSYRSTIYNNWKKDNTVRQSQWGYGQNEGCWFFGNDIYDIIHDSNNTINSMKIKITRQAGGNSAAVTHYLRLHKYKTRPSGNPSFVSSDTFQQTFSLATGKSITITLTSAQIAVFKSSGAYGFGLYTTSTSTSAYSVCSGSATVTINYTTTDSD